ncbi:hypothetical protein CBF56_07575 [Lactobacillus taiwanensis]|uniref:Uncharacterized protein n=1 Tax=Lactobacillus taiwanensis TaxID=508451 RepID=A0A256LHJ1_9LACO|nr:hypothetical protein [Lactobacillus taiwanensis]OYR88755.1 hypothetical protein CBF53_02220 [Lactobacillus taiwanensis]OYR89605.1 hypothetical protein CBF59_10410 [Lactobacillus taiwanensis]OYR92909.1 hypothetical protein CBF70_02440 [Lactobacillus taiwanensis]OYR96756.1 hypothetical protein CBF58_02855 [Lactobacillus taiwanensis]OYS17346.1 hypothetical protein CBF56_07575 [Lactobacillus taiwanensis]
MVTIILVSNSNKEVIYKFLDGNNNYKGQITVNKTNLSYKLKNKEKFTNSYETQAYRLVKQCIQLNKYPPIASKGWS